MKQTKGRIAECIAKTPILGLKRVNASPSPTYSALESEWAKVEAVLKWQLGEPLPWDSTPTLGWATLLLYDRRHLHWKLCLDYANI
ncbi:hypothetical protein H5410_030894, partial [Solanum commersonii]